MLVCSVNFDKVVKKACHISHLRTVQKRAKDLGGRRKLGKE